MSTSTTDEELREVRLDMRRRLIDIGIVAILTAGALLLLRFASLRLFPEQQEGGPEGGVSREPISVVPTPTMPTQPTEGPDRTIVARGEAFGTPYTLAVTSRAGFCVELIRARETTGSCGADGTSVQVVQTDASAGRTVYFGTVPKKAARVWMAFRDSRIVQGQTLAVPESLDAPFSLYLLPPVIADSGEVIAVDGKGLLVGSATASTSGEAGRPVGVIDAYGNVIGFVPLGDWARPPPGRHAALQEIRDFLVVPLTRIRPEVKTWWVDRPGIIAADEAVRTWWAAYPLRSWLTPKVNSRASWPSGRPWVEVVPREADQSDVHQTWPFAISHSAWLVQTGESSKNLQRLTIGKVVTEGSIEAVHDHGCGRAQFLGQAPRGGPVRPYLGRSSNLTHLSSGLKSPWPETFV